MTTAPEQSVLRDPAFARYLAARTLSSAGSIVTLIVLPILVYRISGSASLTALVAACEAAPYVVLGLVAGALTDRWNRKTVMVTADVLGATLVLTLPLAHWLAEVTVVHVLVVAFVGPSLGVFFDGAVFGAIPMLVGRGRIAEANSIAWGAQSLNEILLPSAVGLSLVLLDPADLLLLDGLTFAASAALVASIMRPMHDATREHPPLTARVLLSDIREGLGFLLRHPGVRTMTIVGTLQCLAGGGFVALMVVWVDRSLGVGTEGLRFGLVYGAWAVGGLLAASALPRLLRRSSPERIALVALPFSAAAGLVVPLVPVWWAAALALALWSSAYTVIVINSVSYRQIVTPEPLLGRVNTAGRMLSWGLGWTGGALLAGVLVGFLGTVATMEVLASFGVVAALVAWGSPLRRAVLMPDEEQPTAEPLAP